MARGHVVTIKLEPLAASNVLRKKNVVTAIRVKPPAAYRVREERQLLPLASRHLHQMKLGRLRKPRGNQHLSFRGMPIRQVRAPIGCVPPRSFREIGRASCRERV